MGVEVVLCEHTDEVLARDLKGRVSISFREISLSWENMLLCIHLENLQSKVL